MILPESACLLERGLEGIRATRFIVSTARAQDIMDHKGK